MAVAEFFAGIPIRDFDGARDWYERFFGRPPDLVPHDTEACWRVGEASGWIYVVLDPERATGNCLFTLIVDELDAYLNRLTEHGIAFGPFYWEGESMRCTRVRDPEGNQLTFAEDTS